MSSENFEDIVYDLDDVLARLRKSVRAASNQSGEQRKMTLHSCEADIDRADDYVNALIVEARNAPATERRQMNDQINQYKQDLSQIKKTINSSDQRANLLGSGSSRSQPLGVREQAMENHRTLNKTSDRIANTKRMAYEAQATGEGIMTDLSDQRETIVRIGGKNQAIDHDLSRANRILNAMTRRIMSHKMIMIATIFLLVCILVVVLLNKLGVFHK